MGFTRRLAEYVHGFSGGPPLPPDVAEQAKEMMVNAAAVALAAAAQPESRTITKFAQDMQGNGKCTIIGMGLRSSPVYAALANGTMVHLLDFDDEIAGRGIHPSGAVFPVVMALGEMNGSPGLDVLAAYVVGCEVIAKLEGTGAAGWWSLPSKYLSYGAAGAIGAACAASAVLGLDVEQTENALGLACGAAAGGAGVLPTGARAMQRGQAAMTGVLSGMLAQQGLGRTGPIDKLPNLGPNEAGVVTNASPGALEAMGCWLDTHWGVGQAESGRVDQFFGGLGNPYGIMDPGVTMKFYPCATASHTTVEALLQLMQQYQIQASDVASVHVGVTREALAALPYPTPANGAEAKACLSYIAAATLLHGHPLIDHFSDLAVQDSDVRQAMDRVTVEASETATMLIPNPSTVAVELSDGRILRHRAEYARGYPQLPLDREEMDAKFLYCSRYILPADHIEEAIDSFRGLEEIVNVTGMASVLGG